MTDTMTAAQKKRLCDLMMRDLKNGTRPLPLPQLPKSTPTTVSVDEMLDRIENRQKESIERLLSQEELFRFAYVPFVIAELVWDYADTVILLAKQLDSPETRRLTRAIREARKDYEHMRRKHISESNHEREIENGYVFEAATEEITSQMLANIRFDIGREYPDLEPTSRDLLIAVYQCHVTSRALLLYLSKKAAQVSAKIGYTIGKMLPQSYYLMDRLIPEYIGDKPASPYFQQLMQQYIKTFATQIGLVEFEDKTAKSC